VDVEDFEIASDDEDSTEVSSNRNAPDVLAIVEFAHDELPGLGSKQLPEP
jgi:hypothetical protein